MNTQSARVRSSTFAIMSSLLLFCSMNVAALPVTVSDSQTQTVNSQNFTHSLATSNYTAGTASVLTMTFQGDFNSTDIENIAGITIDGVNYGTWNKNSTGAYQVLNPGGDNFNTYLWSVDFSFDALTTAGFLANNSLDVFVDFSNDVTEQYGWWSSSNGDRSGTAPFSKASLAYEAGVVPEPATLALLGLGLAGLGFASRKKQKVD